MSTLVKAGHVQTCCPRPAADVLQAHPNSPYTAFLATEQDFVESYDQHCARLVEGMSTLIACDSLERRESWNVSDGCCRQTNIPNTLDNCTVSLPCITPPCYPGLFATARRAPQAAKRCQDGPLSFESQQDVSEYCYASHGYCSDRQQVLLFISIPCMQNCAQH